MKSILVTVLIILLWATTTTAQTKDDIMEEGFVYNKVDDLRLHYTSMGNGPLVVLIHGFPDFSYTWNSIMQKFSSTHKVVAIDLRGYNKSDRPKGVSNYTYDHLLSDIVAVIDHFDADKATILGHDWGASIAWRFAAFHPDKTERLIILSVPHPDCSKEVRLKAGEDPTSFGNVLASPGFEKRVSMEMLTGWIKDKELVPLYEEAFNRSDIDAMLNYYRANYPTKQNIANSEFREQFSEAIPIIKAPVLVIHGLSDKYASSSLFNNTWNYIDETITMVFIKDAGHFVHHDAAIQVTKIIMNWVLGQN